ncbi:DUF3883 domain-containing protein [Halomonas sp.]|uniref:DUF3883 domain-containing protein n=1 Tax=Halomonas sp. TaxID=1486246 RepID=UPI00257A0CCA|nr:DUF3883 domain-containing protein [Halomonas sp.]MCJ8287115.1 DUF3883 domain-containing protein [Halomonas sp.]NQY71831.1 DUF3883 domain-containing protein [Halomonas sp.]
MEKLWVIPASDDIATKNIPLSLADGFPANIQEKVEQKGFPYNFAWGAKLGAGKNVNLHRQMQPGDYCLFYTADQQATDERKKAYRWLAKIEATTNDAELAKSIWHPAQNGEHFSLIYFVTKPVKIYLETEDLSRLLTPQGDYFYAAPRGFCKVDKKEAIEHINAKYGSSEGLTNHILQHYALEAPPEEDYTEFYESTSKESEQSYKRVDNLLKPTLNDGTKEKRASYAQRRSTESKKVGDEAELFVFDLLKSGEIEGVKTETVKNVATDKVGWDIEYESTSGSKICVEVKGTVGQRFLNFEITRNELEKLDNPENHYHIYLVAGCRSNSKKLQIIDNIRAMITAGEISCSALTYRVELVG